MIDRQNRLIHLSIVILSLLIFGLLSGCADHSARTQELLAEDYHSLSNDNLTLYYYKLEDQIKAVERQRSGSSISLGLGMGSYGSGSGGSGGVDVTTRGSKQDVATNLRDRRNEVKLEMQHRNLKP